MQKKSLKSLRYCMIAAACGLMASCMALSQEVSMKDLPPMPSGEIMIVQEGRPNASLSVPSGYVMKFERTGGYLGVCDSFWIYPDGRIINDLGKTAKIPPAAVKEWAKSVPPVTPSGVAFEVKAEVACMDCFEYRVTIYDKDGTRTLTSTNQGQVDPKTVATVIMGIRDRLLHLKWD